jgi:hypothetical protein
MDMIAMLSPRIEVLNEHRTVSAKHVRYVVSNVLVLVRRSLAAPPLVNPKPAFAAYNCAYTTWLLQSEYHFKTGFRNQGGAGVRRGNIHQYVTEPNERSNAESGKLA